MSGAQEEKGCCCKNSSSSSVNSRLTILRCLPSSGPGTMLAYALCAAAKIFWSPWQDQCCGSPGKSSPILRAVSVPPIDNCLGAIARVKFPINVVQVEMHGIEADPKLISDFLVRHSLLQAPHHFLLSVC